MFITSTQQLTEGKRQHLAVHVQWHLHRTHTQGEEYWTMVGYLLTTNNDIDLFQGRQNPTFCHIFILHELVHMILVHYDIYLYKY